MSRSSGTGSYGNAIVHREENEFDTQVRARLRGGSTFDDSSPRFEDWSPEKQRASYEGLQRADANVNDQRENADTFLALHPEMPDTTANAQALNRTLEALYGKRVYSVVEFEKGYEVARANNLLHLDKNELAKQAKAATQQRAKVERSRIVYRTEEELETMPIEEIRRLDAIERQKQMQEAGERGGNGF
jgi:hypothetical protein